MDISVYDFLVFFLIMASGILSVALKKIDRAGAVTGIVMAIIIWHGGGTACLLALFLFFTLGSFASSWRKKNKEQLYLAQENDGKRSISNVLANGGVAMLVAVCALVYPDVQIPYQFIIIAGIASACSDTFSSEFGNIYGKNYVFITNFRPAPRGVDGAISLQGTSLGLVGSMLIAISTIPFNYTIEQVFLLTCCGFFGNLVDSYLGATLQRGGYLNNHHVNFLSTLLASGLAFVLCL